MHNDVLEQTGHANSKTDDAMRNRWRYKKSGMRTMTNDGTWQGRTHEDYGIEKVDCVEEGRKRRC